uniref:AraC-like ligand-binding domain-containing protein n=1 Tax=Streptomyces sp. NBC_01001 TaxID=2903713 RepID=UPI002F916498|nr:hypothetical protein OG296_40905 [Streptomyces sp. NBC_01001]
MLVTEFSTAALPAKERFDTWAESAAQAHVRNRLHSARKDDFEATLRVLDLGEVQVSTLGFTDLEVVRTPKQIRESDPELYQVAVLSDGYGHLRRGSRGVD